MLCSVDNRASNPTCRAAPALVGRQTPEEVFHSEIQSVNRQSNPSISTSPAATLAGSLPYQIAKLQRTQEAFLLKLQAGKRPRKASISTSLLASSAGSLPIRKVLGCHLATLRHPL